MTTIQTLRAAYPDEVIASAHNLEYWQKLVFLLGVRSCAWHPEPSIEDGERFEALPLAEQDRLMKREQVAMAGAR